MIPCKRGRDHWLGFYGRNGWVKTWLCDFRGRCRRHLALNDGGRDDLECSLVIKMLLLTITILDGLEEWDEGRKENGDLCKNGRLS